MSRCTSCGKKGVKSIFSRQLDRCPRCMRVPAFGAFAGWAACTLIFFIWCVILTGISLLSCLNPAYARLFPGSCGENDCTISVKALTVDSLIEQVDIFRPVVTHPSFNYGTIEPGDQIYIDAGGCVQRGAMT
jgi:hypothetical protein